MAVHSRKLVATEEEVVGRSGKLSSVLIAVAGDKVWNLRSVDISGAIIYKVDTAVEIPHVNLELSFKTALFAEEVSGTTGELNIVYE